MAKVRQTDGSQVRQTDGSQAEFHFRWSMHKARKKGPELGIEHVFCVTFFVSVLCELCPCFVSLARSHLIFR